MSTYDDSSLFLYPSGYKASVLFAQKPMDANGQLAFTRSNDTATRVDQNGLIEKVRTNLAAYSEQFDNAAWLKNGITVTANATTAPNGTMTADKVVDTLGGNNAYRIFNSVTLSAISYSASFYVKAAEYSWVYIRIGNALRVWFNVSTGVVGNKDAGITGTIESAGNGWYRCTAIIATATAGSGFSLLGLTTANGVEAYTPSTGGQGVFVWGAQLETSDFGPTPYIPTVAAAVSVGPLANIPRIDYLGGGCGKLLLEPQCTNIQLNSEDFSQSNWSKTNSAVVTNQVASPDGYVNADKLNETAVNNIHQLESSRSVSSSTAYTMSAFAKKAERSWVRIYEDTTLNSAYFNLDSGTVGTVSGPTAVAKIENYGNGWYRCSVTYTETGTFGRYRITTAKQDNEASYLGVVNNGIYVWGAQYELGAYATSYIPTLAASVTRGADACSKTGISSLIGQTEGTMFLDVVAQVDTAESQDFSISDGTANNRASIRLNNSGLINAIGVFGGSVQFSMGTGAYVTGQRYKIALAYKLNDVVLYVNGVQSATDTSATISGTLSRVGFDVNTAGTQNVKSRVNQAIVFKNRLPNSELASLTTL